MNEFRGKKPYSLFKQLIKKKTIFYTADYEPSASIFRQDAAAVQRRVGTSHGRNWNFWSRESSLRNGP